MQNNMVEIVTNHDVAKELIAKAQKHLNMQEYNLVRDRIETANWLMAQPEGHVSLHLPNYGAPIKFRKGVIYRSKEPNPQDLSVIFDCFSPMQDVEQDCVDCVDAVVCTEDGRELPGQETPVPIDPAWFGEPVRDYPVMEYCPCGLIAVTLRVFNKGLLDGQVIALFPHLTKKDKNGAEVCWAYMESHGFMTRNYIEDFDSSIVCGFDHSKESGEIMDMLTDFHNMELECFR